MIKSSTIDNNIKEWRHSVKKFYENKKIFLDILVVFINIVFMKQVVN